MYLDWQSDPREYYFVDIEGDDLIPSVLWVLCWENIKTGETGECIGHGSIKRFLDNRNAVFVGHNALKWDILWANRLASSRVPISRIVDTLILTTLYNPSMKGGHSLRAWGERFGVYKGEWTDFKNFCPEMISYCHQDVTVGVQIFKRVTEVLRKIGFSEKSVKLQHEFMNVLRKQQENGFYFNYDGAVALYQKLRNRQNELQQLIYNEFPPERILVREADMFVKSGRPSVRYEKDRERYHIEKDEQGGRYSAYEDVYFNIGSPKQRVEKLVALGWEPEEFTPKGFPKVTEESLQRFAELTRIKEVSYITKWMSISGRANMINNWLENYNHETHCIHGSLFVADTLRLRHQKPNTANVPAVKVRKDEDGNRHILYGEEGYYTYEARDQWTSRPGRKLVGADASGLELRMLAHFLNDDNFTHQVVDGDPHQYNADKARVERDNAKTLIYAIQYGAQAKKVGQIMKTNAKEGGRIREMFLKELGLDKVLEEVQSEFIQGRIELVDGGRVICPSKHAALNYKLQGSGARVMAQAAVFLEGHIRRNGLDSLKVGDIHDEWQYDVAPGDATKHGELAVQSLREAGEELNLRVPIDGVSKEGRTWAETH